MNGFTVKPPRAAWTQSAKNCKHARFLVERYGPLIAVQLTQEGDRWWELDNAVHDARQGWLWMPYDKFLWNLTQREHLDAIVEAARKAGALHRLQVREFPDVRSCTRHESCAPTDPTEASTP